VSKSYEKMKKMTGSKGGHWIKGAIKHKGGLTRAAEARGESVSEIEAHPPKNASTHLMRQINLAKTLRGFHHG
jgi:hypothetical protein